MGVPSLAKEVAAELQGMRPEVAGNALRAGKDTSCRVRCQGEVRKVK